MKYYAGLDIGGTNGRLKIKSANGEILGTYQAEGCSINTDGYEKSRLRCRALVLPALQSLSLSPADCAGICVAASGIDSPSLADDCSRIFEEMGFGHQMIQVMNDCEVFLHLSEGAAFVIISGTGSICVGRDKNNRVVRTGGWNHILSDEGSGFDLGLRFLQAAANTLDGRSPVSRLSAMVIQESGLNSLDAMNDYINQNLFEKSKIGRFSLTGYQAALQGDETALAIHQSGADALFTLIHDTIIKLDPTGNTEADLWLWGSVLLNNQILRQMLADKLSLAFPSLRIQLPKVSALDAALSCAEKNL